MELLPSEFINYASYANVSFDRITQIIGLDLMDFAPAREEDMASREVPKNDEIPIRNWELLEKPTQVLSFKRIVRRDVFQAYQLFYEQNKDKLTLVGTSRFNSILFEAYPSQSDFIKNISEKFENYQSIDQDFKSIQHLSSDEFFVLIALLELFIEKYPTPTIDWLPNELLVFTKESLLQIIVDSEKKIENQTWWQHWKKINETSIPNVDNLEIAILLLANKGFVGILDDVEGKEVFFIGQSLVWFLRALVWWDLGFIIENKEAKIQLFVLQATSLFAIVIENNQNFSLFNINGNQLSKLTSNFMNYNENLNETTTEEKLNKTTPKINFCQNCGTPLIKGTKFCGNCGSKIS